MRAVTSLCAVVLGWGCAAAPTAAPDASGGAGAADASLRFGAGRLLLHGQITRQLSRTSANQPFFAGVAAWARVEVRQYQGEDADAPLVADAQVQLAPGELGFPIAYEFRHADAVLRGDEVYLVRAEFAGGEVPARLVTETRHEVRDGAASVDLSVAGLEPCTAPGAGGFCE